jgi:hypothetical protein
MDKAEIEKILEELDHEARSNAFKTSELVNTASSSLTALIIKWLEGKRVNILDHHEKYHKDCHRCIEIFARNQLITELVEEIND